MSQTTLKTKKAPHAPKPKTRSVSNQGPHSGSHSDSHSSAHAISIVHKPAPGGDNRARSSSGRFWTEGEPIASKAIVTKRRHPQLNHGFIRKAPGHASSSLGIMDTYTPSNDRSYQLSTGTFHNGSFYIAPENNTHPKCPQSPPRKCQNHSHPSGCRCRCRSPSPEGPLVPDVDDTLSSRSHSPAPCHSPRPCHNPPPCHSPRPCHSPPPCHSHSNSESHSEAPSQTTCHSHQRPQSPCHCDKCKPQSPAHDCKCKSHHRRRRCCESHRSGSCSYSSHSDSEYSSSCGDLSKCVPKSCLPHRDYCEFPNHRFSSCRTCTPLCGPRGCAPICGCFVRPPCPPVCAPVCAPRRRCREHYPACCPSHCKFYDPVECFQPSLGVHNCLVHRICGPPVRPIVQCGVRRLGLVNPCIDLDGDVNCSRGFGTIPSRGIDEGGFDCDGICHICGGYDTHVPGCTYVTCIPIRAPRPLTCIAPCDSFYDRSWCSSRPSRWDPCCAPCVRKDDCNGFVGAALGCPPPPRCPPPKPHCVSKSESSCHKSSRKSDKHHSRDHRVIPSRSKES